MNFQADANEIIDDQSQTIAALYKENSILKSQLKAAERQVESLQKQIDEHEHDESGDEVAPATVPTKRPKAVAS